jgi:hypothetical protein
VQGTRVKERLLAGTRVKSRLLPLRPALSSAIKWLSHTLKTKFRPAKLRSLGSMLQLHATGQPSNLCEVGGPPPHTLGPPARPLALLPSRVATLSTGTAGIHGLPLRPRLFNYNASP